MRITAGRLRRIIAEEVDRTLQLEAAAVRGVALDDLRKKWPKLHSYVTAVYRDGLDVLLAAVEGGGFLSRGKPYVYVPAEDQLVSWSDELERVTRHTSPTLIDRVLAAARAK